jgi:hypothetical protein
MPNGIAFLLDAHTSMISHVPCVTSNALEQDKTPAGLYLSTASVQASSLGGKRSSSMRDTSDGVQYLMVDTIAAPLNRKRFGLRVEKPGRPHRSETLHQSPQG